MRHIGLCLILLVSTSACETSTDPFIGFDGGAGLSQTQAAGNWSFTIHPSTTPACASGSLVDGTVLTVRLDVLSDGSVAPATSSWQNPPTMNTAGSFSGTVSDPNPGKFPVFAVCSYSATGVKTS